MEQCRFWYDEEYDMTFTDCGDDFPGEPEFDYCPSCACEIQWVDECPLDDLDA